MHSPVDGGEGGREKREGSQGSLEKSDQHKNRDFQLITVPEGRVRGVAVVLYHRPLQMLDILLTLFTPPAPGTLE